jgi:hypothetical protein
VYTSPEDLRRATMQSRYHSLTPCERKLQDKWATQKADSFAPCPAGYPWERHPNPHSPGYQCRGGAHFMSDGILTEGIPGLYVYGKIHEHLPDHDRVPAKSE